MREMHTKKILMPLFIECNWHKSKKGSKKDENFFFTFHLILFVYSSIKEKNIIAIDKFFNQL